MTLPNFPNRRLTRIANGVVDERNRFYPIRSRAMNEGNVSLSPKTSNSRFFVDWVNLTYQAEIGDTSLGVYLRGTVDGEAESLINVRLNPGTVSNFTNSLRAGVLLDPGSDITLGSQVAFPTHCAAVVYVAEVDDV